MRDTLGQLDITLKCHPGAPHQRLNFNAGIPLIIKRMDINNEVVLMLHVRNDLGASFPFYKNLNSSIREFEKLNYLSNSADTEDIFAFWLFGLCILLRSKKNESIPIHRCFEGGNGLFPANEKWNDHMGEDNDIP
ncbi:hypothetical protein GURASL_22910 [Geotalea uraniireducens]|uniref:Uncharacterized protein n=1 Tax=Geotalea uraniireducens TaxID=351604 RepID=A0ABM8ELC3_9BACT|nr:hypothetical protein GURASL_22910 [Geotalea uraniireducens]